MSDRPQPVFRAVGADQVAAVDPRQLECFIAVAEELNINRAAIRLHMTQPPLTRRIQRLEHDVGVELFRRTPGGMELTEAGRVLLESAYRIVTLSARAVERARQASAGEVGHLSVGYYDSAILDGIPAVLREFRDRYPDVTVSFELVPGPAQADYLRDNLLHVGFGRDYPPQPDVVCRTVALEELYVAVREPSALPAGRPVTVEDLRDRPLVVYRHPGPGSPTTSSGCAATPGSPRSSPSRRTTSSRAWPTSRSATRWPSCQASATRTGPHGVTFAPLRRRTARQTRLHHPRGPSGARPCAVHPLPRRTGIAYR